MPTPHILVQKNENIYNENISTIAKLFVAILLITVFEGAFRKWISNDLTYPLVAIRDLVAVAGIFIAARKRYSSQSILIIRNLLFFSFLVLIWGLIQLIINQTPIVIFLLGLRFWFLYLWFAILSSALLSTNDFKFISKTIIALMMFMTPLVIVQHFSPVNSFINKQSDEDFIIFTVVAGIVRTTGTFSFTTGYTTFLALSTPFVFMSLNKYLIWKSKWLPWASLLSLLASTIVSGSRGAIIFLAAFTTVYIGLTFYISDVRTKMNVIKSTIISALLLIVMLQVFSQALDATIERFESAAKSESFLVRISYTFMPLKSYSFLGDGIGTASSIGTAILTGQKGFGVAESENARVIVEAGFIGYVVLFLKISIILFSIFYSLALTRSHRKYTSLGIWITTGLALLSWQISGQLTVNTLGYLLVGLAVACLRLESQGKFT